MKLIFFITAMAILFITLWMTHGQKEGFLDDYCSSNKSCTSCADASGCSWCPNENRCLSSRILKSTDPKCNQSNTISAAFRCEDATKSIKKDPLGAETNASNQVLFDFTLYKNQIKDKIPPPNAFTTEQKEYSPETVMANSNQLSMNVKNLYTELPDVIATALQQQIKPMMKGILSDNYLIQA
jgi:Plexin repeat